MGTSTFICHYYKTRAEPKRIYDRKTQRYIPNPNKGISRSPFNRREELYDAGGQFAKESIPQIEATLNARMHEHQRFGRADVWFPHYPQVVIQTNQRSCYVQGLVKGATSGELVLINIMTLDPGEWGLADGQPFFVTNQKVFPTWTGTGPWPWIQMCFPNLPDSL